MSHLKPAEEIVGKKVYAYWNLHKDVWSLSDGKHVIHYCDSFEMEDVELRVRQGGYERARREGKKNVHAFAIGQITSINQAVPDASHTVSYNHQRGNYFYTRETEEPVRALEKCYGVQKVLVF